MDGFVEDKWGNGGFYVSKLILFKICLLPRDGQADSGGGRKRGRTLFYLQWK